MSEACRHLQDIHTRGANGDGYEECLKTGDSWVHLRVCMVCGHVGCCDDSKNQHASRHFRATGHPIMRSKEPGETWGWCYVDQLFYDPI